MSKARLWFAALLALHGLSCSSLPVLSGTEAIIRVPNEALDFGVVPLGEVLTLPLHIKNEGRSGAQAAISTAAAAFSVEVESVTLPGGEEVVVPVSFRPKTTGAASARVLVTSGALQFEVSLLGTGVAPCVTAACHSARFDPATRRCELIALADGATCVVPCIADGQCRQGECRGRSQLCDDADPCTADACDANGGCTHHPIVCPVTDSCRAAVCEPGIGCVERPLEDGTACGPADCLTARVCINTHCSSRPTPDSADCQYTSVAANADSLTCATTVSGKVRCWGGPALLQPREVPELRGGVRLAAPPERGMCAVDAASSSVRCFDVVAPDGGFGSPVRQLTPPHVVLEDGRYSTWDDTGALTLQHTGVHALAVTKIPGVATIRCLDEGGPWSAKRRREEGAVGALFSRLPCLALPGQLGGACMPRSRAKVSARRGQKGSAAPALCGECPPTVGTSSSGTSLEGASTPDSWLLVSVATSPRTG